MSELHMMEEIVGDFKMVVHYNVLNLKYRIDISNIHDELKCMTQYVDSLYDPTYGIDVADMQAILAKAEEMCVELETDAKLP